MMMEPRAPLVSINIPCYRQLPLARRCVDALLGQTLADVEITLYDDGDSDQYRAMVESIGDSRLRYHRNPVRLGAMQNMFQSITAGRGKYTIAFHEDDLLGSHYLETAVGILEGDPSCGFVGGEMREFTEPPSADVLRMKPERHGVERFASPADFVRMIFRGVEPVFGSIVYRRTAVEGVAAAHEDYATLVDRPFLMSILQKWSGAIIRDPLVWTSRHGGDDDVRHLAMGSDHILRLLARYRAALPDRLDDQDRALFYGYSGFWLFELYRMARPDRRAPLRRLVLRAWRDGLYDPRWSSGYGRKRLIGLMLTGR